MSSPSATARVRPNGPADQPGISPARTQRGACHGLLACGLLFLQVSATQAQPLQLVHLSEGRLTVAAHDAPLRALVEEIAQESAMVLEGEDLLVGEVTVRFRRRPLAEGLALILSEWRYAFSSPSPATATLGRPTAPTLARLRVFERHPAPAARAEVAAEAGSPPEALGSPGLAGPLRQNEDPTVSRRAGLAALRDPDRQVRAAAVRALSARGDEGVVTLLELALRDAELGIRLEAVAALRRIGGDRAARGLTAALHDRSRHLRREAVDALGAIGGPTAMQLLDYAGAVDHDEAVRAAAVDWLAHLQAGHE